jgi:hypothetical protein
MYDNKQAGYLLEIPLMMVAVGMLLAIFLPILPNIIGKIVFVIGVLVWIAGLYYMIVIPGWQPDTNTRLRHPWNSIVFTIIAALLVFIASDYVFYH